MNFYDFNMKDIDGNNISFSEYKGKIVLVVNTASKCGFTPQFDGLEKLYQTYKNNNFVVLGFPCNQFLQQDPSENATISSFCKLNYGVSFPMFGKIHVNGKNACPLYVWLKYNSKGVFNNEIKWNFTKFLIDTQGNVIKRLAPIVSIKSIESHIKSMLK